MLALDDQELRTWTKMWTKATHDKLSRRLPFNVEVIWDKVPSETKYGHVNSLLAALTVLVENHSQLRDPDGSVLTKLAVAPLRRKITDRSKRRFSIIGLPNVRPLVMAECGALLLEVYFNYHFFYETETTFSQYFPGASLCIRPRNFLVGSLVPSPGSWGSDITSLNWDWDGTFIVETGPHGVPSSARKNFRGFKYLPSAFKIFVCSETLPKAEQHYIRKNGFDILVAPNDTPAPPPQLCARLVDFLRKQQKRIYESEKHPTSGSTGSPVNPAPGES